MSASDDQRTPGFNAPLDGAGPIVSKRTGPRRSRVKAALGAPQKMLPGGHRRHERAEAVDVDRLDDLDDGPARSAGRGIAITLLILFVLGTRGCGLLAADSDDTVPATTPSAPATTTTSIAPRPQLVERLTVPASATTVAGDG